MFEDKETVQIREKTVRLISARLKKFQTHVMIAEKPGGKVVEKYATSDEALGFLKLIVQRELDNVDYLKNSFDVLCGELKNDHIEYEYLPYDSAQDIIAAALARGNCSRANDIFRCYIDKLDSLETIYSCPEEFLKGIVNDYDYDASQLKCFSRGLLDLTPRNIMIDGDKWVVLDNEWSFDFPVPKDFIIFRAIWDMAFSLQSEIRMGTEKTIQR